MSDLREHGRLNLLTALLWGEARGEPIEGKLAVAWVVRNRVLDRRWPDNYEDVILQPWQFSCFLPGDPNRHSVLNALMASGNWGDAAWKECRYAAMGIISNWVRDMTKGANHYNTLGCDPKWDDRMVKTVVIGHHEFFKG
jgi:spore germination cell wall hydrolase CwlJ-like protein